MTNTTHTPGPLHISHFNKTDIVKNRVPGTYLASCYYGPESGIPLAEAEANARLIAAAPIYLSWSNAFYQTASSS